MFFNTPLKEIIKSHVMGGFGVFCEKEMCLTCELGFLFKMLEDAQGMNCHASNFLRVFKTIPQGTLSRVFFLY
jgi:PAB-dependent poly(A)-specific ribonuclease subunit 2